MVGAERNGAGGTWESSGIVEGKEGETAGATGDWAREKWRRMQKAASAQGAPGQRDGVR